MAITMDLPSLTPAELPRLYLITLCFLGAFSRLTHGRYTPAFHRYQTEHAPDDGSASSRLIPVVDATLATLLFVGGPQTRTVAAALCALFQGIGIAQQLGKGKTVRLGFLSFGMAVAAGWLSWTG